MQKEIWVQWSQILKTLLKSDVAKCTDIYFYQKSVLLMQCEYNQIYDHVAFRL